MFNVVVSFDDLESARDCADDLDWDGYECVIVDTETGEEVET